MNPQLRFGQKEASLADIPDDAEGGVHIRGYAAYHYAAPPPEVQHQAAILAASQADAQFRAEPSSAEAAIREAIELLVDAFLLDRRMNAECFAEAHRLGRLAEQEYGCLWSLDDEGKAFVNECGVLALHSRLGASVGGSTITRCSVCGAGAFQCDHIEGEVYDGKRCIHTVVEMNLAEVSLTPTPRDPRTYRLSRAIPLEEAERLKGLALSEGERPVCEHCNGCYGINGPTSEDLDPQSWRTAAQ
jgi:hypothetical protein